VSHPFDIVRKILIVVHQATSDPGLVGQVLQEMHCQLEICCPAIGHGLPEPEDYDGVVVFGGPMSANDGDLLPFIQAELKWIPLVLAANKPYLGVCLGAQLLAKVLGGRVAPHAEGMKEIGYSSIQSVMGQTALSGLTHVYHWHKEGFEIPQGATRLAMGTVFPNQAFQYGRAYGVQFHPEITRAMIDRWVAAVPDYLSEPGAQALEEQVRQHLCYGVSVERWLREFLVQWLEPAEKLSVA
jgi:GMP synthase (glutamine-hydrolysing)